MARNPLITPPDRGSPQLTLVIPTRNRPLHCAAQLQFFKACGLAHPIVIADSSDATAAEVVRTASAGVGEYQHFDPAITVPDKLLMVARAVRSPFVLMSPDDDITFPHAIDAALAHLIEHPDHAAAHGYVLRFGMHGEDIDIHNVFSYSPGIDDDDPLYRIYNLIRRYQPFIWSVFRTEVFVSAMQAAQEARGIIFQEITFMTAAILSGKVARLPRIFAMRGMEESLTPSGATHPFLWFLREPEQFFKHYVHYRNALAQRITAICPKQPRSFLNPSQSPFEAETVDANPLGTDLGKILDLIHATWLGREIDLGIVNHAVRRRLGDPIPPLHIERQWPGWREPAGGDLVRPGIRKGRRYVWRRAVLEATPREEISIDDEEISRVEAQFDSYRLGAEAKFEPVSGTGKI
jgi:glycosyltransferase domain-containing protein